MPHIGGGRMIALYIWLSLVTVRRVAGGCQLVPPTNTHSEQIGHTHAEKISTENI